MNQFVAAALAIGLNCGIGSVTSTGTGPGTSVAGSVNVSENSRSPVAISNDRGPTVTAGNKTTCGGGTETDQSPLPVIPVGSTSEFAAFRSRIVAVMASPPSVTHVPVQV